MRLLPTRSSRTDALFPYTKLFRSTLIPSIVFSVIIAVTLHDQGVAFIERGTRDTTQALSAALDRELEASIQSLRVLGTSKRSEEHTSELQSLMRISYAVFCLTKIKRPTPLSIILSLHSPTTI